PRLGSPPRIEEQEHTGTAAEEDVTPRNPGKGGQPQDLFIEVRGGLQLFRVEARLEDASHLRRGQLAHADRSQPWPTARITVCVTARDSAPRGASRSAFWKKLARSCGSPRS